MRRMIGCFALFKMIDWQCGQVRGCSLHPREGDRSIGQGGCFDLAGDQVKQRQADAGLSIGIYHEQALCVGAPHDLQTQDSTQ